MNALNCNLHKSFNHFILFYLKANYLNFFVKCAGLGKLSNILLRRDYAKY